MLKAKDLREQSIADLKDTCRSKRAELFQQMNNKVASKKAEKPHLVQQTKKEIARLLTVINEKQLQETK